MQPARGLQVGTRSRGIFPAYQANRPRVPPRRNAGVVAKAKHTQTTRAKLSVAEVRRHEDMSEFAASKCGDTWIYSWVHTRGRIEQGSGDGGKDLVILREGGFPETILSGCDALSGAIFSPSGNLFLVQTKDALLLGESQTLRIACCLKLLPNESFVGKPVWVREEYVLFGTSGGEPKRHRLFSMPLPSSEALLDGTIQPISDRRTLFVADHGAILMSWDHAQGIESAVGQVAVIHRLANAMYAEIVICSGPEGKMESQRVVAVDARVEYCKPRLAFLSDGRLLMRLNLPLDAIGYQLRDFVAAWTAAGAQRGTQAAPLPARHGLWILEGDSEIKPFHFASEWEHGTYDVYSGSYGRQGALSEGFVLDSSRKVIVTTARLQTSQQGPSYADQLWMIKLTDERAAEVSGQQLNVSPGKGCYIPVALSEDQLVYHYRSPTERGDLWTANITDCSTCRRCTQTMPRSLQQKLLIPEEVSIPCGSRNMHALLFTPEDGEKLQPLLWIHGGPMAQYSWDYNPLLSWLASLGYIVLVPNFAGSTGSGIEHMDTVLADGCGQVDFSDCLSCAKWFKTSSASVPRLDVSRGIAVGGHSWGGYLAFMCMLQGRTTESTSDVQSVFSCGIATAGIADWKIQQRHTEVRYYDYALMGGWVYEDGVIERARKASPMTHAADLRAPILILHGESDIDVPFKQIPPFVEALRRSSHPGADVEYHSYPGEGHGMAGTAAQADFLTRIETFLRINLKPWDFTDNPHGDLTAY